jgi:hypothetical protein
MICSFTMRLFVIAAILGATGVLAVVACSSSSAVAPADDGGEDAAAPSDASDGGPGLPFPLSQVCPPSSETEECPRCVRNRCCETGDRRGTAAGKALRDCIYPELPDGAPLPCDDACQTACFEQAPNEIVPFFDHLGCAFHYCQAECDDSDAAVHPCLVCAEAKCLEDSQASARSREALLLGTCDGECPKYDTACLKVCSDRYPKGVALREKLLACKLARCTDECQED